MALLFLLVLTASSYWIGSAALRVGGPADLPIRDRLLLSVCLGLALWCLVLFGLGHVGLFRPWLLVTLAVVIALPAPLLMRTDLRGLRPWVGISAAGWALVAVSAAIAALMFVACFAPVVGGIRNDEICTHLFFAKEWLRAEGIATLPYGLSFHTGNAHLLFVLADAFSEGAGPRLVTWLCFVLCLGVVYSLSRRYLGKNAAILSMAIVAVNPLIFRTARVAFVDHASMLFAIAPVIALLQFRATRRSSMLVVAGVLMGVGCGTKPTNAVYAAVTIAAFVLWEIIDALRSRRFGPALRMALLTGAVTVLTGAPLPLRNLLLSGSPTYPPPLALYSLGGGELRPWLGVPAPYPRSEIDTYYTYCLSRYGDYQRSLLNFVRLPWDVTMRPSVFQIGDSVGTLLLSLLPLVLLLGPWPRWIWPLAGIGGAVALLIYFAVLPEARYYMGVLMVLAPVLAWVASRLDQMRGVRWLMRAMIALNVVFGLGVCVRIALPDVRAALDSDYAREYRAKAIPYCETFDYVNASGAANVTVAYPSQVLYYLNMPYRVSADLSRPMTPGSLILDIDYSQTLERAPGARLGQYSLTAPPPGMRLVFESPDARVYRSEGVAK